MEIRENKSRHYNKPQINKINLVMGEAVLIACKSAQFDQAKLTGSTYNGCPSSQCKTNVGS